MIIMMWQISDVNVDDDSDYVKAAATDDDDLMCLSLVRHYRKTCRKIRYSSK